jgi:hypothetical protein
MSQHSAETDAPGHYFPPTNNPGIYHCSFCGLVTNHRLIEPCPSRVIPPTDGREATR